MKKSNIFCHVLSLLVIAGMIVLAFGSSDDTSSGSSSSSSSHYIVANKKYYFNDTIIGFRTRDSFEKYLQFIKQKDNQAARQFEKDCLLTGEAEVFKKNDTVYCSDTALTANMAKVHKIGQTNEYWVLMPFLEEDK